MLKNNKTIWEKEFTDFLNTEPVSVPDSITDKIMTTIHAEMNPSAFKVFSKISVVHLIIGFVTLLFCPQFGISLTSLAGLTHYLMPLGHEFCTFVCGAVFVGTSLFVAGFYLKREEVLALKENLLLHNLSLASLSIGFFIALDGNVIFTMGLLWLAGAYLAGVIAVDAGWFIRRLIAERVYS